jgi:putative ABC transport system ATP-binding protein
MLLYETRSLCKYYHGGTRGEVRAVDDVSLTIERGSRTVVAGGSGSGKTTLLALLGALERSTRGQILFAGNDLADASDTYLARVRRRLGFVFQDFSLIAKMSVEANVTYPLIPRGVPRAERRRRACELLVRFGMEDKLATPARDLSGGQQQRVAIARALIGLPDVLLADEPTSNLDAESVATLLTVFQERHAEGTTVIVSSHDPRVLEQATHLLQLDKGRLISSE